MAHLVLLRLFSRPQENPGSELDFRPHLYISVAKWISPEKAGKKEGMFSSILLEGDSQVKSTLNITIRKCPKSSRAWMKEYISEPEGSLEPYF